MRQPQRHSLVVETAAVLRDEIASGAWAAALPGERRLAERLGVGRDTLRMALARLVDDGLIGAAAPGRRRRLRPDRPVSARASPSRVIGLLSPVRLEEMPQQTLWEVDAIRDRLAGRGWTLAVRSPPLFHLRHPARALAALLQEMPAAAWILYQCHRDIQAWFQGSRQPCLIWGSPLAGIHIPFIDTDWEATACHAGGVLRRAGHQRVGLVMPDQHLAGLQAAEQGLRRAWSGGGDAVTLIRESGRSSLVRALGATLGGAERPTALIVTRARQALTILGWLAAHGMCLPRDLSLISLADEGWFADVVPDITHYRVNLRELTQALSRKIGLLTQGSRIPRPARLLFPDFVPGASVGSPKSKI